MRGACEFAPPRNIHFTLRYGLYKPYELYELSNSLNFASLSRMLLSRHIELMPGIQENHIKNIIDHMSGDDMCAVHMYPCPIGIVTDICRILKSALCGKIPVNNKIVSLRLTDRFRGKLLQAAHQPHQMTIFSPVLKRTSLRFAKMAETK